MIPIEKTTLGLNLPSDPRWVNIAELNIEDILIDHAFCEQKAASHGISLIVHYCDKQKLVEVITPIVEEEWNHFRMVLAEMKKSRPCGVPASATPQPAGERPDALRPCNC